MLSRSLIDTVSTLTCTGTGLRTQAPGRAAAGPWRCTLASSRLGCRPGRWLAKNPAKHRDIEVRWQYSSRVTVDSEATIGRGGRPGRAPQDPCGTQTLACMFGVCNATTDQRCGLKTHTRSACTSPLHLCLWGVQSPHPGMPVCTSEVQVAYVTVTQ